MGVYEWLSMIAKKAERLAESFYGFSPKTLKLAHSTAEAERLVAEFMANMITSPEFKSLSQTQQDYASLRVRSYLCNHIPKNGDVLVFYGMYGLDDLVSRTRKL